MRGVCTIGSRVKGSAFGYPVNCCCAMCGFKSPVPYVYAFVGGVVKGDPFIAVIASGGVLVEGVYNLTFSVV